MLQATKQGVRDSWAKWNPQRRAAQALQQSVQAGEVTLQATVLAQLQAGAYAQHEPLAGSIPPADAEARGWYGHPKPFAWPAAKDSQVSLASHRNSSKWNYSEITARMQLANQG